MDDVHLQFKKQLSYSYLTCCELCDRHAGGYVSPLLLYTLPANSNQNSNTLSMSQAAGLLQKYSLIECTSDTVTDWQEWQD